MDSGGTCLTILLTWRCPAECAHCVFESGPAKRSLIDVELASDALRALARRAPGSGVSFSGGEPFVALAEMRQLIGLAHGLGLSSEICTSAAWVSTPERARAALEDLQQCGLRVLAVSLDRHHLPFVPARKVATVIREALALGLRVVLKVLEGENEISTPDAIAEALEFSLEEVACLAVKPQGVVEVGRATREMVGASDVTALHGGACRLAGANATLTPEGDLYTCCGPVVGRGAKAAALFRISGPGEPAEARFAEMDRDLFAQLLRTIGPAGIIAAARRNFGSELAIRTPVNQCDLCLEMTRDARLARAVDQLLDDAARVLA